MPPRCSILFLILGWSILAIPQTQSAAPNDSNAAASFKTKSRLVLVDVVVTNNKGEPMTGLKKEDFEILEDGKPQVASTFEEHKGVQPTQLKLPPMPPGVYTNFPLVQAADSVDIILLDALNTPTRDQTYVRSEMLKYLKTIPAGSRVAVFTLASRLRMLQGITTDSSELLAAINSNLTDQSPLLASDAENEANQHHIAFLEQEQQGPTPTKFAQEAVNPVLAAKQFMADTAAFQTMQRIDLTLDALQQMARYLSGVPGRKNVIWFSGTFPAVIFPDTDLPDPLNLAATFQDEIRKTTDLLAASQMALYPIAAEGLAVDKVYEANAQEISEKRPSMAIRDQMKQMQTGQTSRDLNHQTMEELAADTGGKAFYNSNGLGDSLSRVVNNGSRFYTLTYVPTNGATDGKYRHIQMKLVSAKGNLAYRRGYYADDLSTSLALGQKPDADPLMPLIGRNMPDYTQILYKVLVQPSNPQPAPDTAPIGSNPDMKGPFTRYGVDFAISLRDLKLEPAPDNAVKGKIEVAIAAYDREGKPLNLIVTPGDILLKGKELANVQKGGLQIHKEIDVPEGYAFLRTGVYDLKANTAGTLGVPLAEIKTAAK
jgi:VWFA-related protein